ncbi:MAG: mannonate dehydratase [Paracoccaceae bacterium]|nr:mannonate dehydratase [Paracoccaceae bacterium]
MAKPATKERLEAARQIGAEDVVYYSVEDRAAIFDQFGAFIERAKAADLRATVVEAGPPIGKIVMGEDGWREQTDDWVDAIRLLASHGVEVICYNFMPQVLDDAMVVRTNFETKTRGGAITSSYRAIDVDHETLVDADVLPISKDEMRANLKRFLDEVIPVAEEVGIKLAMHPDDPPTSLMGGLQRIMSSVEDYDWLLAVNPSKANGITYCIGCFAELGCILEGLIDRWSNRIHFVHFRNISGCQDDFVETFPDDGDVDLLSVLRKLNEVGYTGCIRPDHAPKLSGEYVEIEGYGFQGHIFTAGYLRGLLTAIASE